LEILKKVAGRMAGWDEPAESKTSDIGILKSVVKKMIASENQEAKEMTGDLKILGNLAAKMINDSGKNGIKPDLGIMEQVAAKIIGLAAERMENEEEIFKTQSTKTQQQPQANKP
jgi:hypothetical protein